MSDPGICSRPSPIAGLGLFATRAFAPQERIAAYTGRMVTRPPDEAKASGKVFALEIAPGTWLDGSTEDNLSRHANHACHPNAELVWAQDEPQNQGPWFQIQHNIFENLDVGHKLAYAGRPASASPAVGYYDKHYAQQKALIDTAFSKLKGFILTK